MSKEERKDLTITDDLKPVLEMLKPSDASAVVELREELANNWQKKQIFRTETEMRISVLNDAKHPTNASKYWQSVREQGCLLYTSPSPRDGLLSRMPSSA